MQEALEFGGGLGELPAGRTSLPVLDQPLLDQVAVPVVLVGAPAVGVDVHGRVDRLHLDREQAGRAEQQVIDLAAAVEVPVQQRPFVAQRATEFGGDPLLALDPRLELFLGVGIVRAVAAGCAGRGTRRFATSTPNASRSHSSQLCLARARSRRTRIVWTRARYDQRPRPVRARCAACRCRATWSSISAG